MKLDAVPEEVTRDRFLVWRSPRVGLRNPHPMPSPVWAWLARNPEINAWRVNAHFGGPSSLEVGPCWCAQRFTRVHVLDTADFAMRRHVTRQAGAPTLATATAPGWIHGHEAALSSDEAALLIRGGKHLVQVDGETRFVRNADDWSLDLERLTWTRLTHRPWRQLAVHRADEERNALFDLFMLRYHLPAKSDFDRAQVARFVETHGRLLDVEAYDALYVPSVPHERIAPIAGDDEASVFPPTIRILVDGVVVQYVEGSYEIALTVEGALPDEVVEALAHDLEQKLAALEGVPYARTLLR